MEQSLRNRLTFGPMLLAGLFLLLWVDHAAQRWTKGPGHPAGIGGIGLLILLLIILPIATREIATLFTAERIRPYRVLSASGSGLLVLHAFATQFPWFQPVAASTLAFLIVFVMLFAALTRAMDRETDGAIHRMAGSVLSTMYLGGLGWFLIALRVKHGAATTCSTAATGIILMILLVGKSSTDIGAYFGGRATRQTQTDPLAEPRQNVGRPGLGVC